MQTFHSPVVGVHGAEAAAVNRVWIGIFGTVEEIGSPLLIVKSRRQFAEALLFGIVPDLADFVA